MPDSIRVELCHSDVQFLDLIGEWLRSHPTEHGLIDDVLARSRAAAARDKLSFHRIVARRLGEVVGFAVHALPRTVFLPVMHWSVAAAIARDMCRRGVIAPTLIGPAPCTDAFASSWTEMAGIGFACRHELVLYEARAVIEPRPVAGELKNASAADLDRLVSWQEAFVRETKVSDDPRQVRRRVTEQMEDGRLFVWDDGGLKACVAHSPRRLGGSRIYGVYTPKQERSKGYASAMIARLTRRLLDTGSTHCILFADAHNETSRRLYLRVGYRERGLFKELEPASSILAFE